MRSDGKIFDYYSSITNYVPGGSAQGANYDSEGDSYNREHSIPKSWWGGATTNQGADPYIVVPTDGYVNNARGNDTFGVVAKATKTFSNSKYGTGSSTYGYTGNVFEPDDSVKGDFARIYFYAIVKYSGASNWRTGDGARNFSGSDSTNNGLTDYAVKLFTKWHHDDPVSDWEIGLNDRVSAIQGNRNPFIDHPEYANVLWGKLSGGTMYEGTVSNDLTISKTSANLSIDETTTISAVSSNSSSISWSTSDSNVVSISSSSSGSGEAITLTANSGGSATITASATVNNVSHSRTCFVTVTSSGGSGGNGDFTLVTSNTSLSNGDQVILSTDQSESTVYGVTGWNGTNDATVSNTSSEWMKYSVSNVSSSGFKLKDETANKYIASPTDNHFKYSDNAGIVSVDSSGKFVCNSRYLCKNGTNYRCYTSVQSSFSAFYIYKVASSNKTLSFIDVETAPTKLVYNVGETFSPTGLVISRTYSDDSSDTYSYANHTDEFEFSPTLTTALKTSDEAITISYGGKSCSQDITVNELVITSIAATVSKTYYVGETISSSDITVKDNNNNTVSSFTFSNDGYQFKYSDASSGGALTNKTFTNSISGSNKTCSLTVEVQRKAYAQPEPTGWTKVTSTSSLSVGDQIIIADSQNNYALSTEQKNNNRGAATITKSGNSISWSNQTNNPQILTLVSTSGVSNAPSGSFGLSPSSGNYLYAASASSNYLRTKSTLDVDGAFVITISSGVAKIKATASSNNNLLRSNSSNNPPIFSCYEDKTNPTGNAPAIYKQSGTNESAKNIANYIMYEDTNNQCKTKLTTAIGYLNNLSGSERADFLSESTDYCVVQARARLNAWAANQGKTITTTANGVELTNNPNIQFIVDNENTNVIILIAIISMVGISSIGACLYIRKKRSS